MEIFQIQNYVFVNQEQFADDIDINVKLRFKQKIDEILSKYGDFYKEINDNPQYFKSRHDAINKDKFVKNGNTQHLLFKSNQIKSNQRSYSQQRFNNNSFHKPKHVYSSGIDRKVIQETVHTLKPKKQLSYEEEFQRKIVALLNKISPMNFDKIRNEIIKLCTCPKTSETVVHNVIKKCFGDFSFIHLYIDLLYCIPKTFLYIIDSVGRVLLDDFVSSLSSIIKQITLNIHGENNLSNFIKAKKVVYDTHKSCCVLMIHKFIDINPSSYLFQIRDIFKTLIKENEYEMYDIYIHFIFDFFSLYKFDNEQQNINHFVENLQNEKNDSVCDKRTHFKWIELNKLLTS
jgi:hypothetical protein